MGRRRSVDDVAVSDHLATVFRTTGYDGASLADLSQATGLRSASLYHRFPGGKEGMALAALDHVETTFAHILAPLTTEADVTDGIREMARRVGQFYDDGRLACVLDTMTLHGAPDEVRQRARRLARGWIEAMTHAAARAGADDTESARRARDAFVRIEGALVLSRVLGDRSEFQRTLDALPDILARQSP
jgi:TetR/AcrR family transcriptional repressor of lmrAB and yxaGH operons